MIRTVINRFKMIIYSKYMNTLLPNYTVRGELEFIKKLNHLYDFNYDKEDEKNMDWKESQEPPFSSTDICARGILSVDEMNPIIINSGIGILCQ